MCHVLCAMCRTPCGGQRGTVYRYATVVANRGACSASIGASCAGDPPKGCAAGVC